MRRFLSLLAAFGSSALFAHCGSTIVVVPCFDGETDCGGECVDTTSDPDHCGGCGVLCPVEQGLECVDSICEGTVPCPVELTDCGNGVCTDLASDPLNCGGCGVVCPTGNCVGFVCQQGCAPPLQPCPDGCVDVASDPFNCGGCNIQCPDGWACQSFTCVVPVCPPNLTLCGGQCVDTLFDSQHCGGCFNVCPLESFCDLGDCVGGCTPGSCSSCGGEVFLPSELSVSTAGFLPSSPSGVDGLCGEGGSGEVAHLYTAPAAGTYFLAASVEGQEATLLLFDDFCGLIGCGMGGQLSIDLDQGQTVIATVDSSFGGFYELAIDGTPTVSECPTGTISTVPFSIMGSTVGAVNSLPVLCASDGADHTYLFTAPTTDTYRFDTVGSSYDTLLAVVGGECGGPSLGCDDDGAGNFQSLVQVSLTQGQTVTVVVDGFAGNVGSYVLNVTAPP
jgi:hypothetical protein